MGVQVISLAALRVFVKFNPAIAIMVSMINNPFTVGPLYYLYYAMGCRIMGNPEFTCATDSWYLPVTNTWGECLSSIFAMATAIVSRCALTAVIMAFVGGVAGYMVAAMIQRVSALKDDPIP
jgi:uncharacterized protein (DUF2062 family)